MPSPTPLWRGTRRSSQKSGLGSWFAAFCVLWLSSAALSQPPPSHVAVVAPSDILLHALTQSLAAWNVQIQAVPDDNPGPSMPASSSEGRRIAGRYNALAVVWVSESESGFALWVFDQRTDRVLARPLPSGPPFDEPMAAQVALAVKTMLRSIPELAPGEAAPGEADPPDGHRPVDDVNEGHGSDTAEHRVTSEPAQERAPTQERDPHGLDVLVAGGLRGRAVTPGAPDARFLLGATLWPSGLERALGLSTFVESGPGVQSPHAELDARWTDSSLMFAVRGRLRVGTHFDLGATLGFGARLTTLHGETNAGSPVARLRVTPISRVEVELGAQLARWLRLEIRAGTLIGWSVQRYFTGNELALDVSRVSVQALIGLEFRIR